MDVMESLTIIISVQNKAIQTQARDILKLKYEEKKKLFWEKNHGN